MFRTIRWSAIALICVCLTAGAAQAWPLAQAGPGPAAPELASRLQATWHWLVSLLPRVEPKPSWTPSTPQTKSSCSSDPWGQPVNCNS